MDGELILGAWKITCPPYQNKNPANHYLQLMKIFDAHFHIINPTFPLVKNQGYLPPSFTTDNYTEATRDLDICGGVIVSGSFQAFDQSYLIDALQILGNQYIGVANIPAHYDLKTLEKLNQSNVVGVRFNLKRGGSEKKTELERLSNQLYDQFGWHTELYVDAVDLAGLKSTLTNIPKFSIDHLGLSNTGLNDLYYWVEKGVRVKATGFGRIDFDPIPVMKQIYRLNPDALMFGTDLPSTRAQKPFSEADVKLIQANFSTTEQQKIFGENAKQFYQR